VMVGVHGRSVGMGLDGVKFRHYVARMTVAPLTKPYHHGDLAQASLRVALVLLAEKGLDRFSLREVARRLGVSLTALYHYYPDKESLLSTIAEQGMIEFRDALHAAVRSGLESSADPIVMIGQEYVRFFTDNPHYQDLLFLPAHKENPAICSVWHETFLTLTTTLGQRGWNEEQVPFLGLWLWSSVHGLARMFRDGILGQKEGCAQVTPLILTIVTQARNIPK
jgi:AcrR family transcriptional regulator